METKFRPSSSGRWMECPGSLYLKNDKRASDKYSIMGTAAHEVFEQSLKSNSFSVEDREPVAVHCDVTGLTTYVSVDDGMKENINFALQEVRKIIDSLGGIEYELRTEHRLDHEEIEHFGGTVDVLLIAGEFAWVIDLKYGTAKIEADSNQMACYAILVRDHFPKVRYVTTMIIQPRSRVKQKVRRKNWSREELKEFQSKLTQTVNIVKNINDGTVKDNLKTGGYCWYCPARLNCPEKQLQEGRRDFAKKL